VRTMVRKQPQPRSVTTPARFDSGEFDAGPRDHAHDLGCTSGYGSGRTGVAFAGQTIMLTLGLPVVGEAPMFYRRTWTA
jgi:hypothetical protein